MAPIELNLHSKLTFYQDSKYEGITEDVYTRSIYKRCWSILEEMCSFEVSSQDVSRASKLLDDEFIKWRNRPLGQYCYMALDARESHLNCVNSWEKNTNLYKYKLVL